MTRPDTKGESKQSRREFLWWAVASATGLVFAPVLQPERSVPVRHRPNP